MTRSLGPELPAGLVAALSQSDLVARLGRAVPALTLDAEGRPHPMLCSYLELLAPDPHTIRLAIGGASRSARNLEERRTCTLLFIEPERTVYVKCRASGAPLALGPLKRFVLSVEDVLEDAPADWEDAVRITGGIRYEPVPDLDGEWARRTLAALRIEPAG